MKVIITYTYKDEIYKFDNVDTINQTFDYKLGARIELKINGKRNKVRISLSDVKNLKVID